MKKLFTLFTALTLAASPVFAQETETQPVANGHRVGIGFTNTTDVTYDDVKLGTGLKLEYGYEFNNIVGINLSYSGFGDDVYTLFGNANIDGSTFKLDTDLGYTFHFEQWALKPYLAIGIAHVREEFSNFLVSEKYSDTNLFLGIGARATIMEHYYTDLRIEGIGTDFGDYGQFSMTFGYRF